MLRRQDQDSFEAIWSLAAYDAPAIKMADDMDVEWGMLFAICRNQQQRIDELEERVDELSQA